MLQRLEEGFDSPWDRNFAEHELIESGLMDGGMGAREAHLLTLEQQGIPYEPGYERNLYHPDVIEEFPEYFNPACRPYEEVRVKDYLSLWLDGLPRRKPKTISAPVRASGKFDGYLVYGFQRAEVELEVEPSSSFEVVDALHRNEEVRDNGFLEWAVFGLLDVLMFAGSEPICNVRVVLKDVDYDRIECSQMAFRLAGRIAGQQIVGALSKSRNSTPPSASGV